ncbi:hypothetical protein, partial [Neisseria gonorrhoeae]|uniref:hypothetical protein n=11 Tax=Neisseria gonorrhoeae TaxID=485 RepID=UPI001B7FCA1A
NNTIKPEKQAMFFNSICQCIRFQHVSRMKMYGGLTKIRTRRRSRRQYGKARQRRTGLNLIHYTSRHSRAGGSPDRLFGKWGGGLRACQIKTVFKRVAMRHMQGLEAQSIYYFHRNGRPRPPCKPLKDKPPGLIRAAVGNHLPFDLFEI